MVNKMETMQFKAKIPSGTSTRLYERIKSNGTIEKVYVRFYPGQEGTLQVRPYINHIGQKIEDLVTYPNGVDHYLSGDDDFLEFPVSIPVANDDEVAVYVQNTGDYDYTLDVKIVVDYRGGLKSIVGGVF